jgi:hypothetical protein
VTIFCSDQKDTFTFEAGCKTNGKSKMETLGTTLEDLQKK